MSTTPSAAPPVTPPGRLGHPEYTLRTDPRSDPRMVAALAPFGVDGLAEPAPVSPDDPLETRLAYIAAAEEGFEALFAALVAGLPPVAGVSRSTETIAGVAGDDIRLYVSRPAGSAGTSLPGVLHVHGGEMTLLGASGPAYARFRDELAATGMVVVGVEFRNAAGVLGTHPFPAGLDDCTTALGWMHEGRERLGLSKLLLAGESGGANLILATTLRAGREGTLDAIDGVYAMVPFVSGAYGWPDARKAAELPSLLENDGYFISSSINAVVASLYDPEGRNTENPLCWPYWADEQDLAGLPPHVITVNELDPLRDEGLAYHRKLARAGVDVVGRDVIGICHGGEIMFRAAMPGMYLTTVADVRAFADRV